MYDSWCRPLFMDARWLYGAAARNKRIKISGGLENICREVADDAARMALDRANARFGQYQNCEYHNELENEVSANI